MSAFTSSGGDILAHAPGFPAPLVLDVAEAQTLFSQYTASLLADERAGRPTRERAVEATNLLRAILRADEHRCATAGHGLSKSPLREWRTGIMGEAR